MRPPLLTSASNESWRVVRWCALAALTLLPVSVLAQVPATLTLGDALTRALDGNPSVLAARSARAIDLAGMQAAGQRPNPEVSVEAERETPHWSFGGSVPIEVSGKRQRRIDVAQATLSTTEAETARVMAEVRSDVRRAYFSAVGALRRLEAAQELEGINSRSAVSPWASTIRRGRCRPSPAPDRV